MFVVFSPVRKDMKEARTFKPLESWCDTMSSQRSLCVVKPPVVFYDDPLMWDSIHVGADGARQFSRDVAQRFDGVLPTVAADVQAALAK